MARSMIRCYRYAQRACNSVRCPPAIDWKRDAGDRCSGVGSKENRKRSQLLHRRKPLVRLLGEEYIADYLFARDAMRLGLAVDLRLHERCVHVAGADRVAGDALLGGLERNHLGEADET